MKKTILLSISLLTSLALFTACELDYAPYLLYTSDDADEL